MRKKEKEFKSPLTAFQLLERIIVKDSIQLLDIANLLKNILAIECHNNICIFFCCH
jgi:hypothetical protein